MYFMPRQSTWKYYIILLKKSTWGRNYNQLHQIKVSNCKYIYQGTFQIQVREK